MKKINLPVEPLPEAYKSQVIAKKEVDVVNIIKQPTDTLEIIKLSSEHAVVPNKTVLNYDLKKMKSFRVLRKQYKSQNQLHVFLNDMTSVLSEFLPEENQLDLDLLVHVLNISEQYFIYGSKETREETKSAAVKQLMVKYFRNDEEVLNKMIVSVWKRVNKSNMFKRFFRRISNKLIFF